MCTCIVQSLSFKKYIYLVHSCTENIYPKQKYTQSIYRANTSKIHICEVYLKHISINKCKGILYYLLLIYLEIFQVNLKIVIQSQEYIFNKYVECTNSIQCIYNKSILCYVGSNCGQFCSQVKGENTTLTLLSSTLKFGRKT